MTRQLDAFIDLDRTFSKIRMDSDISDDTDLSSRHGKSGDLEAKVFARKGLDLERHF
jgi:hypothetical protein